MQKSYMNGECLIYGRPTYVATGCGSCTASLKSLFVLPTTPCSAGTTCHMAHAQNPTLLFPVSHDAPK